MSEENNIEVEQENPIANMIDYTTNGDFNKANVMFSDILNQKIQDALEQEKVSVASTLFDDPEEESEDDEDQDFSDEELDAAAEDALNDMESDEE